MELSRRNLTVLASALAMALPAMVSGPTHAQQQEQEQAADMDRVQVTGSRIRRSGFDSPAPVQIIDRDEIDRSGHVRLADLIQEISSSGSAINTAFNSPDSGGDGSERVSLRNLGPDRTLVLVNGRRWVRGTTQAGVSNSADLSTIPVSAVERIEILTGGASSIYGSDAIAGVVNIITRKDFTDTEVSAQYGSFDDGDGEEEAYSLTMGRSSDKGNILVSLSHTSQKAIMAGDRKISRVPTFGADQFGGPISRGSSATPEGRFVVVDPTGNVLDLTRREGAPGTPTLDDLRPFDGTADRFNFAPDNFLQIPLEQTSAYIQASHEFSPNFRFFTEGFYNKRESDQLQAPVPLFLGSAGILPLNVGVSAENPFNPFGFDLDPNDNLILIGRRAVEFGTRDFFSEVDTWRWTGGLEGNFLFADRAFDWDISYTYSQSDRSAQIENLLNHERLAQALGPLDQCTGSCVPFNLFGGQLGTGNVPGSGGSITPEMIEFVTFTAVEQNEQEMVNWLANISGEVIDLPYGPLTFAAGFEKRREFARDTPDSTAVAGAGAASVSGGVRAPTSGRLNMEAFHGEVNIPLLANLPGARVLEIDGSLRYTDFDQFSSETVGRIGLRWRPIEDLLVRASFAEGFRAPGVQELFGGLGVADPALTDPCSNFLTSGASQTVIDNCIAQGVPTDGSFEQINPQIRITRGGNPDLEPETSDSITIGGAWTPEFIPGLRVSVDYFDIELENSITSIGAQSILNACAQSGRLCNLIERSVSGEVSFLLDGQVNIGRTETSGIDFAIDYQLPTRFGQFRGIWQGTWLDEFTETVPDLSDPGAPPEIRQLKGRLLGGQPDRSFPDLKTNLDLLWAYGAWEAAWRIQHIGDYTEDCSDGLTPSLTDLGLCSMPNADDPGQSQNRIGSTFYHDVQLSYHLERFRDLDARLSVGVNNLFDRDPPVSFSAFANSFDATQHRIPGSVLYGRLNVTF